MSIQNVIRSYNTCTSLYRGTTGSTTSTFATYTSSSADDGMSCTSHKGSVWFKGKLFLMNREGSNTWRFNKYDLSTDSWSQNLTPIYTETGACCLPNMIVCNDRVYVFCDYSESVSAAYNEHKMKVAWFESDMVTENTDNTNLYCYGNNYDKNISTYQDINHVHDLVVHKGIIYIAGSYGIYSYVPDSTTISAIWEIQETGTNGYPLADNQTAKCFGVTNTDLYCLFANGTINKIGGVFSEEANLNNVITGGSGIITGVDLTGGVDDISIGYGCYLFQNNHQLHAFVNASGIDGNGVVGFSSTNGVDWSQTTEDIVPLAWRGQVAHIKGCMDPSNNEQRVLFLNADNNASFEEFVFNGSGTAMTSLGSSSVSNFYTYNFWNDDAVDVESENAPVVSLTAVTANYILYNESSGTVNITPKYSIDNGGSWHSATRKAGQGSGLTNLPSETLANGGKEYVFVWDYRNDLGYSEDYTNVKLQFITSLV